MARGFTDFSDQTVGTFPSGWTGRILQTTNWEIIEPNIQHGKAIASTTNTNNRMALTLDAAGEAADVEIYLETGSTTGFSLDDSRAALRLDTAKNTSAATAHLYACGYDNPDIEASRYVNGSFTNFANASPSPAPGFTDDTDVYCTRIRINGTSVKIKFWDKTTTEPIGWDLETTDSGITTAGAIGLFSFSNSTSTWWSAFGWDTDGGSAPTEPVTGGAEVSANTEALTLTEYPAAITLDVNIGAAAEALSLTTQNASVGLDANINTAVEQLQISSLQSDITLDANILCGVESLSLSTYQAAINDVAVVDSIDTGYGVNPYAEYPYAAETALAITYLDVLANQESLALTTYPASLSYDVDILANSEALSLTTNSATFVYDVNVNAAVEQLSLDTNQATLDYSVNILSATESLTLTPNPAAIYFDVNLFAESEALTLESYPATIGLNSVIFAEPESLSITTLPTTIGIDTNVLANTEALELTGNAAQILFGTNVLCGSASLEVTGLQASFIYDVDALPQSVSMTVETLSAFIGFDVEVLAGAESLSVSTSQSNIDALYLSSDYGYSTGAYSEHPYADVALIGFGSPQVDPVVSLLRLETRPATIIVNDFIPTLYSPTVFIADESPAIFDAVDDVPRFEVISMIEIFEAVE